MSQREDLFVEQAYANGHSRGTLAEAAIALWKAYCKADLQRQRSLIGDLIAETARYAREAEHWDESAADLRNQLVASARRAL